MTTTKQLHGGYKLQRKSRAAYTADLRIRSTPELKALVEDAARIKGLDISAWARLAMLEEAQRVVAEEETRLAKAAQRRARMSA